MDRTTARIVSDFARGVAFRCPSEQDFIRAAAGRLAMKLDGGQTLTPQSERLLKRIHTQAKAFSDAEAEVFSRLYVRDTHAANTAGCDRDQHGESLLNSLRTLASRCPDGRVSHPYVIRELNAGIGS